MEPVEYPIDGVLDLHLFAPQDAGSVTAEYLRVCQEAGVLRVRIIHGKGKGVLRCTVHAVLDKHPAVADYRLATDTSAWGATIAFLHAAEAGSPSAEEK